MITGYFYFDVEEKNGETRQIKKIFKLVLEANVLYLLWDSFYAVLSRNMSFLLDTFTIENVLKFIAFNESPLKGHLWYLGAILYVLIIMHIFDKLKIEKCLVFAAPFLLMGDLIRHHCLNDLLWLALMLIQQEIIISVRPYWLLRYSYLPCNVMGVIKH